MELISIVVPVYNVQAFLSKCLESLLAQTYEKVEIILVDDGSTDGSGYICDWYEKRHGNIHVIHKENGGLSDARNRGLEDIHGEYVIFVDSDDVIDVRLVEYLYKLVQKYDADIGICDPVHCYLEQDVRFEIEGKEKVFLPEEAMCEMLYQRSFLVAAWGKIYPAHFFKSIKFPTGILFEDSAIMYKLFDKARCIAYSNAKLYGYMHRENSITTKKFSAKDCDILTICEWIDQYMNGRDETVKKAARSYHAAAALRIYMNAPRTGEFEKQIAVSKAYLKKNCSAILRDRKIRVKMRMALLLYRYARPIMPWIYKRIDRWK